MYALLIVTGAWARPLGDRGVPIVDRGDAPEAGAVRRRRVYPN